MFKLYKYDNKLTIYVLVFLFFVVYQNFFQYSISDIYGWIYVIDQQHQQK